MLKQTLVILLLLFLAVTVYAEDSEYAVKRTSGDIVLDGILDEEDWAAAESFGAFVFPWWTSGEKEQTNVKMLWNDTYLYLAYTVQDKHIWADHYDTNSWTYKDDAVEFFWNPNPEAGDVYYFFEMNCAGNLLCVYDFQGGDFLNNKAMVPRIASYVNGTVNNDSDSDSSWILEIAVRFSDYPELSKREAPIPGDTWRVNLNRCGGKTNYQYSQWTPSQTSGPNFYRPEDFGRLLFTDTPVIPPAKVTDENYDTRPEIIAITGSYPNPFNPSTTIEYSLRESGYIELAIYNTASQKVRELVSEFKPAGTHAVIWDGKNDEGVMASSGIYISHIRMGAKTASGRMLLIK